MLDLPACDSLLMQRVDDHVLGVTMNRPARLNAIDATMGQAMHDLVLRLADDPDWVRAVVLSGAGSAFSTGADLKIRQGQSLEELTRQHRVAERTFALRTESPVPWIAAVSGPCYAGGLETALTCDFIYADRQARFALTECRIGLMPGCMGTQHLPRAVGERRAKELILSGRTFGADEAHAWGLVNEVCDDGTVLERALACARQIAECAPLAVRQAKKAIHAGLQTDLHTGYRLELEAWHQLIDTEDRREGIAAFNEKRKPVFKGR